MEVVHQSFEQFSQLIAPHLPYLTLDLEFLLPAEVQAHLTMADGYLHQYGMDQFDSVAQQVSDISSGALPLHGVRTLLCMMASFPLAAIYRMIPNVTFLKHLFNIITGIWLCWYCFGKLDWLHSLFMANACYILSFVVPRSQYSSVNFVVITLYLMAGYTDKFFNGSKSLMGATINQLTWTLVCCVMTLKMIAFGFNYTDGGIPAVAEKSKFAVKNRPNWIEFMGFSYCHCGLLSGPYVEYVEYSNWVSMAAFGKGVTSIPSGSFWQGMRQMFIGFPILLAVQAVLAQFPPKTMSTDEFLNQWPWIQRVLYMFAVGHLTNLRYAIMWAVMESAFIMSGLGYMPANPKIPNAKPSFRRFKNADVFGLEMAKAMSDFVITFNIRTNNWLRMYISQRMRGKGFGRASCLLATFFYLALWHGFWPGYYICFMWQFTLVYSQQHLAELTAPIYSRIAGIAPLRWIYNLGSWLCYCSGLYFIQGPFWLLALQPGVDLMNSIYYFAPAVQAAALVLHTLCSALGLIGSPAKAKKA